MIFSYKFLPCEHLLQLEQNEGEPGDIRHQHQHHDDRQQKRNGGLRNLFEGNPADVDRRKEADAHGWGGEPDAEIQADDHTGVYRVDPHLHHRRRQDRSDEKDRGGAVHEHADDKQRHVDQQQFEPDGGVHRKKELRQTERDPFVRQNPAERVTGTDEQHDRPAVYGAVQENLGDLLPRDRFVDELRKDKGIQGRHRGCFRRSEIAGDDTAQDEHRQQQTGTGFPNRPHALFPCGLGEGGIVVAFRVGVDQRGECESHQNAGKDSRDEEVSNRDFAYRSVYDEREARRNDGGHRRGDGGEACAEVRGVTLFFQGGDHDRSDGRGGRDGGAGDRAEKGADHDVDDGEPAFDVPDKGLSQSDQSGRDAPVVHEVAGEDEEGEAHHQKGIHTTDDSLRNQQPGYVSPHGDDIGNRREDQDERDRYVHEKQDEKGDEHDGGHRKPLLLSLRIDGGPDVPVFAVKKQFHKLCDADEEHQQCIEGDREEKKAGGYGKGGRGLSGLCGLKGLQPSVVQQDDQCGDEEEVREDLHGPLDLSPQITDQNVHSDMDVRVCRAGCGEHRTPDEEVPRHLLGPLKGVTQKGARDHLQDDDHGHTGKGEARHEAGKEVDLIRRFLHTVYQSFHKAALAFPLQQLTGGVRLRTPPRTLFGRLPTRPYFVFLIFSTSSSQ